MAELLWKKGKWIYTAELKSPAFGEGSEGWMMWSKDYESVTGPF